MCLTQSEEKECQRIEGARSIAAREAATILLGGMERAPILERQARSFLLEKGPNCGAWLD